MRKAHCEFKLKTITCKDYRLFLSPVDVRPYESPLGRWAEVMVGSLMDEKKYLGTAAVDVL